MARRAGLRLARLNRLYECGWDEPVIAFMREHVAEMERTPFDGCVFHVDYPKPGGGKGSFTWECWGRRAFMAQELKPALDDLNLTLYRDTALVVERGDGREIAGSL